VLLFNAAGFLAVFALQRLQLWLPMNPQGLANVPPDLAESPRVSWRLFGLSQAVTAT